MTSTTRKPKVNNTQANREEKPAMPAKPMIPFTEELIQYVVYVDCTYCLIKEDDNLFRKLTNHQISLYNRLKNKRKNHKKLQTTNQMKMIQKPVDCQRKCQQQQDNIFQASTEKPDQRDLMEEDQHKNPRELEIRKLKQIIRRLQYTQTIDEVLQNHKIFLIDFIKENFILLQSNINQEMHAYKDEVKSVIKQQIKTLLAQNQFQLSKPDIYSQAQQEKIVFKRAIQRNVSGESLLQEISAVGPFTIPLLRTQNRAASELLENSQLEPRPAEISMMSYNQQQLDSRVSSEYCLKEASTLKQSEVLSISKILHKMPNMRMFLVKEMNKFIKRRYVQDSDLIFKKDRFPHSIKKYFPNEEDNFPFMVLMKSRKGKIFGVFSEGMCSKEDNGYESFMFSIDNKLAFYPSEERKDIESVKISNQEIIYGNNELKIKCEDLSKIQLKAVMFGVKYYTVNNRVDMFGEEKDFQVEIDQFELHRIILTDQIESRS